MENRYRRKSIKEQKRICFTIPEPIILQSAGRRLDSLNEGIILKSLKESCRKQTVVLVSHRTSPMNLADTVYEMDRERVS